uniref:7DB family n=1 Tax=Argas monolakensis TaxID=34602 RepID=Q09JU3_ARGMO|nr:7DB family [Argas monolakensis]
MTMKIVLATVLLLLEFAASEETDGTDQQEPSPTAAGNRTAKSSVFHWAWCITPCKDAPKYKRIMKENAVFYSCSYVCNPATLLIAGCYMNENNGARCLNFDKATRGLCKKGTCVTDQEEMKKIAKKRQEQKEGSKGKAQCPRGKDYLWNKKKSAYQGCSYYCAAGPHRIVNAADGTECLDPNTAREAQCKDGYCSLAE